MRFRHPGSYWSDTSQKLCPWSEKPKDLPPSDCKLALTCYGGHIVHSRKKEIQRTVGEEDLLELLKPPCSRGAIILHGLVPNHLLPEDRQAYCKMRHSKAFLDCLQTIAPDIKMPKGELGPAKEKAYRELNKHLPHLLFLKPNKYWSFCIDAYEKFELGGLMKYIDENIRDNDLAPPELVPPGWKGIRASLLIRLAHQYGPVQEAHGRFSFKFSKNKVGWFFRELFLHLTKKGAAAEPKGSIMIFEEGNKLKAEQYPFDEIILLEDIEY